MKKASAARNADRIDLPRKRFSPVMFEALAQILKPGEYISHASALFMQGLTVRPAEVITIVSSHRRRNRVCEGWPLRFVFHSGTRNISTCRICCLNKTIAVATPETALIDLLTDLNEAPDLDGLINLAARLPFSINRCLKLAENISNTVFKRVVFLLAFCGRLSNSRIPYSQLKKSPAVLDPRIDKNELRTWDRRFWCFFPTRLLSQKVATARTRNQPALSDWLIIRNSPAFLAAQKASGHLIVRGDPGISALKSVWEKTPVMHSEQDLVQWASRNGLFPIPGFEDAARRRRAGRLIFLFSNAQAIAGIKKLLATPDFIAGLPLATLDLAIHLALLLEEEHLLMKILAIAGEKLVDSVVFRGLKIGADVLLQKKGKLPTLQGCLLARTTVIGGDPVKAAAILKKTTPAVPGSPEWPWQCLSRGMVLLRSNRWKSAQRLLITAKRIWSAENEVYGLARAENALGNLCLGLARIAAARKHYLAALRGNRRLACPAPVFLAGVMFNLSITYLHLGQREKAAALLRHSLAGSGKTDNFVVTSRCLYLLAQTSLFNGILQHSQTYLYRCLVLRNTLKDRRGAIEAMGMLSWNYTLTGQHKTARYWEKSVPARSVLEKALHNMVRGRNLLLECSFAAAGRHLKNAREYARSANAGIIMQARLEILLAIIERQTGGKVVAAEMKIAERVIASDPHLDEISWFAMVRAVYSAVDSACEEMRLALKKALATERFDPFWFLLARDLVATRLPEADNYIRQQDQLSPVALKRIARAFLARKNPDETVISLPDIGTDPGILLFQHGTSKTRKFDLQGYQTAKDALPRPEGILEIDFVAGEICFAPFQVRFRPSSLPASVLALLLQVAPVPMAIEHLYQSVWNADYDEEFDLATMKTTFSRIRQILGSVCPSARLNLTRTATTQPLVQLHLPVKWRAWLPESQL